MFVRGVGELGQDARTRRGRGAARGVLVDEDPSPAADVTRRPVLKPRLFKKDLPRKTS